MTRAERMIRAMILLHETGCIRRSDIARIDPTVGSGIHSRDLRLLREVLSLSKGGSGRNVTWYWTRWSLPSSQRSDHKRTPSRIRKRYRPGGTIDSRVALTVMALGALLGLGEK